jgi:hypothetical protein
MLGLNNVRRPASKPAFASFLVASRGVVPGPGLSSMPSSTDREQAGGLNPVVVLGVRHQRPYDNTRPVLAAQVHAHRVPSLLSRELRAPTKAAVRSSRVDRRHGRRSRSRALSPSSCAGSCSSPLETLQLNGLAPKRTEPDDTDLVSRSRGSRWERITSVRVRRSLTAFPRSEGSVVW